MLFISPRPRSWYAMVTRNRLALPGTKRAAGEVHAPIRMNLFQAHTVHHATVYGAPGGPGRETFHDQLADLRASLRKGHEAGDVDAGTYRGGAGDGRRRRRAPGRRRGTEPRDHGPAEAARPADGLDGPRHAGRGAHGGSAGSVISAGPQERTFTNVADGDAYVGFQAQEVHIEGGYHVGDDDPPERQFEVGLRYLEISVPPEARELIMKAAGSLMLIIGTH